MDDNNRTDICDPTTHSSRRKKKKLRKFTSLFKRRHHDDVKSETDSSLFTKSEMSPNISVKSLLDPKFATATELDTENVHVDNDEFIEMRELQITVIEASDLIGADKNGFSDPYVKLKVGKISFKTKTISKTLEPKWLETFFTLLPDSNIPEIFFRVFDRDFGKDDTLGLAVLNIHNMEIGETKDEWLIMSHVEKGKLHVKVKMSSRTVSRSENIKNSKKLGARGMVALTVIEAIDVFDMKSSPDRTFVRMKVGKNKFKTKIAHKSHNPEYKERFDVRIGNYFTDVIEMSIYQVNFVTKDVYIGGHTIILNTLTQDFTNDLWLPLDRSGKLHVLITLTTIHEEMDDAMALTPLGVGFFNRHLKHSSNVGTMKLMIYRGCNLAAADIGGTSDPYVVVELDNVQRRTNTIHKTLNPEWNKAFFMDILDIHSILEINVYDEDRGSDDFLGVAHVPLLQLLDGKEKTIVLKNRNLCTRGKGTIVIQGDIDYSVIKACLQCIKPRTIKYLNSVEKFKVKTFKRNVLRLNGIVNSLSEFLSSIQDLFQWKNSVLSVVALNIWIALCIFIELWWIPLCLIFLLVWNWRLMTLRTHRENRLSLTTNDSDDNDEEDYDYDDDDDDGDDDMDDSKKKKMEKNSLRKKFLTIERICTNIQNSLNSVVSGFERIESIFSWNAPFFSRLFLFIAIVATLLLYFVPIRILLLLWGINKFTKKFRVSIDYVPSNELVNLLSRVPNCVQMVEQAQLKPIVTARKKSLLPFARSYSKSLLN